MHLKHPLKIHDGHIYSPLGKIKLSCYTLLQVLCDISLQAYTIFIYLKRQMKLTFSTIIQDKQYVRKNITLFFTFADKNLFKYLHLLLSSDFSLIKGIFIINKFNNLQLLCEA